MNYILIATISYSLFLLLNTVAARSMSSVLAAAIVTAVSVVLPIIMVIRERAFVAANTTSGVIAAVVAGVFVALYSVYLNKSFAAERASIVVPIVYGGALVLTTLASWIVLKERITSLQLVGLTVMTIGITIVIYARIQTGR